MRLRECDPMWGEDNLRGLVAWGRRSGYVMPFTSALPNLETNAEGNMYPRVNKRVKYGSNEAARCVLHAVQGRNFGDGNKS